MQTSYANSNTDTTDLRLYSRFKKSRVDQQTVTVAWDPLILFSLAYRSCLK